MPRQVTCRSGLKGWQQKLQGNYVSLEEFTDWCAAYAVHTRLGYDTPELAWEANPTIQGSTDPDDLEVVGPKFPSLYKIVRVFARTGRRVTVGTNYPLAAAQEHCSDPETSSATCTSAAGKRRTRNSGQWMDVYTANR